jgi:hypothetical protein
MIAIFLMLLSGSVNASELPCNQFETLVTGHDVEAYQKQNGTTVPATKRVTHCREIFPGTKNWADGFKDITLPGWPYPEKFKPWTKAEKEIVLNLIAQWPEAFKNLKGIALHRAVVSQFKDNPGASFPKANAIVLYDSFFASVSPFRVLSHELGHIQILTMEPRKLELVLLRTGWAKNNDKKLYWSGLISPLKQDSPHSPSEDLANHIEDFLHARASLQKARPEAFKALEELLGSEFKLKENK